MIDAAVGRIPVARRLDVLYVVLAVLAFAAGYAANLFQREHVVTRTVTHRLSIQEQYGHPSQIVDGAQVNPALAGLKCSVYPSRKTILCHP